MDTADVEIYGDVMIDGTKKNLKLTPDGKVYVNAISGNQFVVHAPLIFLGGSTGNKVGLCANPVGSYLLTLPDAANIFLYYTGGDTSVEGVTSRGGSLASYVENRTGVTPTDGDATTYHFSGTSTYANNLTPGSGADLEVTLVAPAVVGAAGQVLSTTDAKGTSSWASLGSLLNTTANNADKGKFLQAGNTGAISWTKLYVPSGVGTLNQVWATTNVTTGSEAANWTSMSTLLSSMTGVANNTYLRGFKTNNTASVAWSNICFPTSYSDTANTVWTTTTASREDASGAGGWKTIPDLLGATSTNANKVLVATGNASGSATGWKTIDATLVNFTEDTSVETTDTAGVYKVSVDYSGTVSDTVSGTATATGSATYPGYYLGWGTYYPNGGAGGTRIYSTERNSNNYSESWMLDHYEFVTMASSKTYSPTCSASYTKNVELEYSGTTTGSVQINVGLS